MKAIYKRELKAYFTSPLGYIVTLIYVLMGGVVFTILFSNGSAELSTLFSIMYTFTLFLMPVLTMRLFSDELRMKTDQALFTAPVKIGSIVMGKYFAALTVFLLANSLTIVYQLVFSAYVSVEWLVYFDNVIGSLLLASALISIGLFISSLTESQMTAAMGSMSVSIVLMFIDMLGSYIDSNILSTVVNWLSFSGRYNTFIVGIVDYANIAFFLSITAIFLFLTVRVQEKRRWS
ncbi:MAG: ABC transporter permease [Firmicutes bacterium]|nr:ABC transporter permease [Bacillota bacterium]